MLALILLDRYHILDPKKLITLKVLLQLLQLQKIMGKRQEQRIYMVSHLYYKMKVYVCLFPITVIPSAIALWPVGVINLWHKQF